MHVNRSTRILHTSIFLKCTASTHAWHEICAAMGVASTSHDTPLKGRICCHSRLFIQNVRPRLDTASLQVCVTAKHYTYLLHVAESFWFSVRQEIPRVLRKLNVHHRIHRCPPPVPILSQFDPAHTPTSQFSKIHLNIILSSMTGSSVLSLSLRFPHQNPAICTYHFPHTCYMPNLDIAIVHA